MDYKAPDNRLYVVVGILQNVHGYVLIQQRRPGTPKPGKWEFPGGKLEEGEEPAHALERELKEELGIEVGQIAPLTAVTHNYDHARVWLDTYLVTEFDGEPEGREGQNIAWVSLEQIRQFDVLDAVIPIVQAIREFR
ncbi:MAG: (deoxy)nucleoside triphosphate pyrophosphohydrolase [Arenicellales bacterium]